MSVFSSKFVEIRAICGHLQFLSHFDNFPLLILYNFIPQSLCFSSLLFKVISLLFKNPLLGGVRIYPRGGFLCYLVTLRVFQRSD